MSDEQHGRVYVLRVAESLITGARQEAYGDAVTEFQKVAAAWSIMFGWDVDPEQVPQAMVLLKMIRLQQSPTHVDSWVDIAGYTALGAETACRQP